MRAIRVHATGGPDQLRLDDVPVPEPAAGQALVRLEAIGVNFIDTYHRSGLYPMAMPFIVGQEGAGVVERVGARVSEVRPGERVAWAGAMGAYAERAVVAAERLVPVPSGVSAKQAAAVMLQGMTAHYLACSTFPLKAGDTCLVQAAAGGVGLLLVQVAKLRDAYVIAAAGSDEKCALAMEAGADEALNYTTTRDVAAEVRRRTGGRGVHVVYDGVGQATFEAGLDALAPRGMMVTYGNASGAVKPLAPLVLNQKGSLFLTRPKLADHVATRDELLQRADDVLGWVREGMLKVRIHREYPLAEAAQAHRDLEGRKTTGKLLLVP